MYLSIRGIRAEGVNAGKVAEEISQGFGGGHDTFAGAQIPLPADGTTPADFFEVIWERFVTAIRAKKSLTRPLTVPPDAVTEEDRQKGRYENGNGGTRANGKSSS